MWSECFFRAKTWSWWFSSVSVSSLWVEDVLMFTFSRTSTLSFAWIPIDTGCKWNVHKTFRRRLGLLLNVLCTFNIRPVSTGILLVLTHLFVVTILLVLQPYLNVQPSLTHVQIFLAMSQMTSEISKSLLLFSKTSTLYWHEFTVEEWTITNFIEVEISYSFSNFFDTSLFKLTVWVKLVQFYSHYHNFYYSQGYNAEGQLSYFQWCA